ncbi:hypothetical protein NPIL_664661 [Nephila pilipes]|uniref:Uncharacterized protein n=1 Tax=Nephila pilipes TaxID=299642 RepID=A0A8X6UAV4_NEPPI|nr:hypothetical protein NPIL_664661 [Nephila pilipes]
MCKSMNFEFYSEDVENLEENDSEDLTTEKYVHLQSEQVNFIQEDHSSEKDEDREDVSISMIKKIVTSRMKCRHLLKSITVIKL